jgi:hypothetical protein
MHNNLFVANGRKASEQQCQEVSLISIRTPSKAAIAFQKSQSTLKLCLLHFLSLILHHKTSSIPQSVTAIECRESEKIYYFLASNHSRYYYMAQT